MNQITLLFDVQVLEENLLIFSKYFKNTMNGIANGGKTLRERILKKYLTLWNKSFWISTLKNMYKITTN